MEFKRTHRCTELSAKNVGETVVIMGWVQKVRDLGHLIFVDLRDRSGILQLVMNADKTEIYKTGQSLHQEYVIEAKGVVCHRAEGMTNANMKTGEIEIDVSAINILSAADTPPFVVSEQTKVNDEMRLKYRYLDLRRQSVMQPLEVRHKVAFLTRQYFAENGFWEIETPMLTKSTPEGARDYLVPSRVHPGSFYALPQSPQQYKQLLMVSGMDRYFQIVKCFRDEDLRADRQPEFTQIDLEMSFVDVDDVIRVNEGYIARLMKEIRGVDIPLPLPRLPYSEAMRRFGSDKPDTRFGMELFDLSETVRGCGFSVFASAIEAGGSVRGITVKGGAEFSRKEIDALGEYVKTYRAKGLAWISLGETVKSPIAKFFSEEELQAIIKAAGAENGDLILMVADKNTVVFDSLGNLRVHVAKKMNLLDENKWNFLWVTDFPLLEYNEEEGRYTAMHHPFTCPRDEDAELLETSPEKVLAKAYDIVLNGVEVGGGSIRIHRSDMQARMFKVIGMSQEEAEERFGHLLEAFRFGTPPHGGLAYGLDRLVMLLCGCSSIRDVIAFPKVQNASELMTAAPSPVDDKQLEELCIALVKNEKTE
ncbi:MAG: aspartate--tRNA ligase [Ruminococcaceae bacterium]|nr:aspartate--tRNA ligase [Oscillospiraceae bacterium]